MNSLKFCPDPRHFRNLEKKAAQKLRCCVKWGAKKRPKDKYYFFKIKYSKTSLTTTLIRRPLCKLTLNFYSLLLSQLPYSSSFESLFHQTNIRDSAVIQLPRIFQHGGKASGKSDPCRMSKVSKSTQFLWIWCPPFLDPILGKRPHKITEGGPFDPHWPISRISPAIGV